jgi:hypothetical protein
MALCQQAGIGRLALAQPNYGFKPTRPLGLWPKQGSSPHPWRCRRRSVKSGGAHRWGGAGRCRGAAKGGRNRFGGWRGRVAHRRGASHGGDTRWKEANSRRPDTRSMSSPRGSGSITGSMRSFRRSKRGWTQLELPYPQWGAQWSMTMKMARGERCW